MRPVEYAIVDIETTGSQLGADSITEIGIVITDGEKVIDRYETLVNPQARIPKFITYLTGINEEMVADAPVFSDVAKEIQRYLEGRVFVAHNVNFDYKIVKGHMDKLGLTIPSKRICTVRLSRKIIPGYPSYSLGKISASLGLKHQNAHRAMGDAEVTAELFHILVKNDKGQIAESLKGNSKESTLPANLSKEAFDKLPSRTGIYYFHDSKGRVIYIGKAKNLKKRVSSHFTGKSNMEKGDFLKEIFDVTFTLTGNDVIAALYEDAEIKHYWPKYNNAQKARIEKFGVYKYEDSSGKIRLGINKITTQYRGIMQFPTLSKARTWLLTKVEEFELNPTYCGLSAFDTDVITSDEHHLNMRRFLAEFLALEESVIWTGYGRSKSEIGFVMMENGVYRGFGFVEREIGVENLNQLKKYLVAQHETHVVRKILISKKLNTLRKIRVTEQCIN